jgi:hypothetical protein
MTKEIEMIKHWLAGVSVFALTSGAALAQSASPGMAPDPMSATQTTTTTTMQPAVAPAPVSGTYHSTGDQKTYDSNGAEVVKHQAYTSSSSGTSTSSSSTTMAPDGSAVNSSSQQKTTSPNGDTTTSRTTNTTNP